MLLLAGTAQARQLAANLVGVSGLRVVSSLAGRLDAPHLPVGEVRTGGFGGTEPMADWLRARVPALVVDATHPFAVQVSIHAVAAAGRTDTPLLRLQRPGWQAQQGDRWWRVGTLRAAADLVPTLGRRPLVTTGRQGLRAFTEHPGCAALHLVVRCVEPPREPTPPKTTMLLARGPFTVADELTLMREHRIDVVVTKDSGGADTSAKLAAARALGLPVVLVDRPTAPRAATVTTVDEAIAWVLGRVSAASR